MTVKTQRLFDEFAAQDTGAFAWVRKLGKHLKVAAWNNQNLEWDILPEGEKLLQEADAEAEEAAKASEAKPAEAPAKPKAKKSGSDNLDEL